ncbi:PKD domain-containing protein [Iamia sp. SCSIO 61187]|uniref:PKD domain-containing protein n=1 Tax=Iamia sp. SCSIO 61187 TaxID=2722752 RepID=UPI001C633C97|nr:PKD domain-containing protein [Iamia sp. SCSIO 61187]QYG94021.1 PKD domain-containing protein [Iamia sp. SCSIO 61187]
MSSRLTFAAAPATGRRRWSRLARAVRGPLLVATMLVGVTALPGDGPAAIAAMTAPEQATLVNAVPTETTPHVTDGNVRSVAVVGDTVVLGGDFTRSTDPDGTVVNRSYVLAFDRATGRILRDWAPDVDNEVYSVVAGADGQSVYIGGRFNRVDGVLQQKVARLSIADGSPLAFQSGVDAVVTAMALAGDRLYIGGVFQRVQGRERRFAALDATTGAIDDDVAVGFEGTHRGGGGKIWRIEPSPDGEHIVVVGSFATVGGQPRNQIVKLDTNGGGQMTVSPWSTTAFAGYCASFTDYVRDVSYSPDGSYFVVVTTGAKGSGLNGTCDAVTRWADTETPNSTHQWVEYSGGDSYYSVEVTGAAVYVGGHFRWSNNSYGTDSLGAGGIATSGIAALDPMNGLPLSWNPGRTRGRAVWQMVATTDGLYVASDTDRIADYRYRARIAFFPLAGGRAVPQPARLALPIDLHQYVPSGPARIEARGFDGQTVDPPSTAVADATALAGTRAAFAADGVLYTAHSDGTLRARSYDGTTLGSAAVVDLQRLTAFATDLANMTGAVLDEGRLFYTVSGSNRLHMRYFSVENRVVGAQRFDVASSGGGLDYRDVGGMVLAGEHVYYVDRDAETLVRATWRAGGGIEPSGRTTVSDGDDADWATSAVFALPGEPTEPPPPPANEAPTAAATVSCTDLGCAFDGSGSQDPDGDITSYAWDFGDGGTGEGVDVTHDYAEAGTYEASLTVTDDDGATAVTELAVTVTAPAEPEEVPPVAQLDVTCTDGTCVADGSASTDDGTIVDHQWDFGDGATASGASVEHTYASSGTYRIVLTVTDDQGLTHSAHQDVEVQVEVAEPTHRGFVAAAASADAATTLSDTVTIPTEVEPGDQLVVFVSSNAPAGAVVNGPAGWSHLLDADTSRSRTAVFSHTAVAGDAGSEIEVSTAIWARTDVVVVAYRGLTVDAHAARPGYTTPSVPVAAPSWVVSYWADKSATTTGWETPAGVATRNSHAGSGVGYVSAVLADSDGSVPPGASAELTATVDQPVPNAVALTLVLVPLA